MPNDPQWLMSALAAQDAYRGDEPAWPPSPEPMGAVANPWADFASRDQPLPTHTPQREPDKYQRLAGGLAALPANAVHSFFGGPAAMNKPNPYPASSEEAQYFENTRADIPYQYGPATALGLWGMGPRVKGGLSATGGSEIVQPQPMSELAKPFYSAAEQAVASSPLTKAPPEQWLGTLRNTPGIKADELERLGLEQFLRQQPGAVPKQTLADYVAANKVDVGEVRKGPPLPQPNTFENYLATYRERFPTSQQSDAMVRGYYDRGLSMPAPGELSAVNRVPSTKFQQWQLPGGENYRETLLTMPDRSKASALRAEADRRGYPDRIADWPDQEFAQQYRQEVTNNPRSDQFTAGHFPEPNVLVHYRTNDRVIDGKKTLFLEEVQSDWHQKGREQGYAPTEQERQIASDQIKELRQQQQQFAVPGSPKWNEIEDKIRPLALTASNRASAIPDAPFKTTWHELALKRAIRDAAEGGYDQIAWTPGSVQNARYDLSKQVDQLDLTHNRDGIGKLGMTLKDGRRQYVDITSRENLADTVGKDVAEKLYKQGAENNGIAVLSGLDLQMGGEGMRGFYDKMLPAAANKLGKKHGAQVGQGSMPTGNVDKFELGEDIGGRWRVFDRQTQEAVGPTFRSGSDAEKWLMDQGHTHIPVHTLPITPSLRETALRKGFPLFTAGAVTTMGALAAQDRYAE